MAIVNGRTSINMHTWTDTMLSGWKVAQQTQVKKYFIIQEREVSYRFTLHQHPYVQRLTQRLLQEGTSGLQAADTEYVDGSKARPDSVEIELDDAVELTIPDASRAALRNKVMATVSGAPFELAANLSFTFASAPMTRARAFAAPPAVPRLRAMLIGGLDNTPLPGSTYILPNHSHALVRGNTLIKLTTAAPIVLAGGATATLPVGTELALADSTELPIPNGASVKIIRCQRLPLLYASALAEYAPTSLVERPYAVKDLDFSYGGAYAVYNWELFYHVPLTMAIHLSKNGRYAEAQRWFHYLFDPTDSSEGPTPERFWKVLPFQTTDVKKVEEILVNLVTGADPELREETIHSINAWKAAPFRPHVIARYRQQAYMYKTVMAYLDNVIAWGDSLFRQDTGEAIDEALMLYVLAANILGPRPQPVPVKGSIRPQTYHNLREDLKHFGSVLRDIEADPPFDLAPLPDTDTSDGSGLAAVRSLGRSLYFCVPRNDKLLGYWDTVADRLFKIRNSLNIQGIFRQLALFEPPIDPALLARAAAAGLDVGAIVSGLNQPLPLVRFQLLIQKATEIVQEVKSLGNNLLAAMEKEDGEAMAILRARHERVILEMAEQVRYMQLQEAIKTKEGLLSSLELAMQRYVYYQQLLGKSVEEIKQTIPTLDELDTSALEKMAFKMDEPAMPMPDLDVALAQDIGDDGGGKKLNPQEAQEITKVVEARGKTNTAGIIDKIGGFLALIPDFTLDIQPFGAGTSLGAMGGGKLATAFSGLSSFWKSDADKLTNQAGNTARIGGYSRRELDWAFQSNLAAGEVNQTFKQLRAAQIREAVASQELKNHRKQIANAKEIEQFLNEEGTQKTGKKTNRAFYAWMKREVKGLYTQCFQFAFDIAKMSERALQNELGDPSLTYVQFGYLAGKEGLLAGEKLFLDLKRMEMAYHELNAREYELTKHVSLLQVNPMALLQLRTTGRCTVMLPEALFDFDGPGHYFRRIKSVALSIPCVTGPYTGVNCTLTLLKSSIRKTPVVGDQYARIDAEDSRFSDYFGSLQAIVTSAGQNDSGLFETNLHDERYLPFENSGAISEWQLELPANPSRGDPRQFDYDTISDVILHIRYTAREGGGLLHSSAITNLTALIEEAQAAGSVQLFSMRHEFPTEWARFKSVEIENTGTAEISLNLRQEHFPFWSKGRLETIKRVDFWIKNAQGGVETTTPAPTSGVDVITHKPDGTESSSRVTTLSDIAIPKPPNKFTLKFGVLFDDNSMDDLWLALTWGK